MNRVRFLSKITLAAGFALAMVTFIGCNEPNNEKQLLGSWITEDELWVFNPDGTGAVGNKTFKYVVVADKLSIDDKVFDLVISNDGKSTILTPDRGNKLLLKKATSAEVDAAIIASAGKELSQTANTWTKLQQAYIIEMEKTGDCSQIGYTPPKSNEHFKYECNLQNGIAYWTAINSNDLGGCKAGNKWVINMDKQVNIKVELPDEPCQKLTPNFQKLAK